MDIFVAILIIAMIFGLFFWANKGERHRIISLAANIVTIVGIIATVWFIVLPRIQPDPVPTLEPVPIPSLQRPTSETPTIEPTPTVATATATSTSTSTNATTPAPSATHTPTLVIPSPTSEEISIILENQSPLPILYEVNYEQESQNQEDVNLFLKDVEILSTGRMLWNIDVWNQSAFDRLIAFENGTVLIDEFGNVYELINTNAPFHDRHVTLQSGAKAEYWFEFPAPEDNAHTFEVRLEPLSRNNDSAILFSEFSVSLSPNASQTSPETSTPIVPWPVTLEINHEQESQNQEDVNLFLKDVEILSTGRMLWNIDVWNQSAFDRLIAFENGTVLIDEFGNVYELINTNAPFHDRHVTLQSGAKAEYWFEFPAPEDNAHTFKVRLEPLSRNNDNAIVYPEFTVFLDY